MDKYNLIHSFDADKIIRLIEEIRGNKPEKETIDQVAEKLGISSSSYKRYLAGDTSPLAKNLETALQICLYTNKMLFQLYDLDEKYDTLFPMIQNVLQLSESNQLLVDAYIKHLLTADPDQNKKIFSQKLLTEAVDSIGTKYYKILKINLSTGIYEPVYVKNSEWSILPEEKTFHISNWFRHFITYQYIHPDDVSYFEENANLYCLRTMMRFTNHDSSIHYRRLVKEEYHNVCMEIFKCSEYTSENPTIFMCIREDL